MSKDKRTWGEDVGCLNCSNLEAQKKAVLEICDHSKSTNIHHEDCGCTHCQITRILKEKS